MNRFVKNTLAAGMLALSLAPLAAFATPASLKTGMFVSGAHATSGKVTIYKLDNGERIVRLTDFTTSNGPKVHVVLADHVVMGNNVTNAHSIDLGDLKGTTGNQNYVIPASVNLRNVKSVVIYCERFHVTFGTAAVR